MSYYITGLLLIDAPASALNNGQAENNESKVKAIRVPGQGDYPYVSAQSFRYWLRDTLSDQFGSEWTASKVYTAGAGSKQQAYTEGDPIEYPDDDLFGYMRATKDYTVTRVSPFRTSTLVSIAPAPIVSDFGVMARAEKQEGDKEGVVLHAHQFYRAVLQGMFSIDLQSAGTFTNQMRSGFQNLAQDTLEKASNLGLTPVPALRAVRLPLDERVRRVQVLLRALSRVQGGAKQTLHYTDVAPVFVMAAVTRGGNNLFGRAVTTDARNRPTLHWDVLNEIRDVQGDSLASSVFVGRSAGFMDDAVEMLREQYQISPIHPRQALDALADEIAQHPEWWE